MGRSFLMYRLIEERFRCRRARKKEKGKSSRGTAEAGILDRWRRFSQLGISTQQAAREGDGSGQFLGWRGGQVVRLTATSRLV